MGTAILNCRRWVVPGLVAIMFVCGCGNREEKAPSSDSGRGGSASSGSRRIELLPTPAEPKPESAPGPELSTVKGVSIRRTPADRLNRSFISSDMAFVRGRAQASRIDDVIRSWYPGEGWVFIDAKLPEDRYDVQVDAAPGETIWPRLAAALEQALGLSFIERTESADVIVIRKTQDPPPGLQKVDAESTNWQTARTPDGYGYDVRAGTMRDLVGIVRRYVDVPVLDETGLKGYYRFTLSMEHADPATVFPAVKKLGLELARVQREIPVLRVVEAKPREPASAP